MGIWVVSILWLSLIMLLWTFVYRFLCKCVFSSPWVYIYTCCIDWFAVYRWEWGRTKVGFSLRTLSPKATLTSGDAPALLSQSRGLPRTLLCFQTPNQLLIPMSTTGFLSWFSPMGQEGHWHVISWVQVSAAGVLVLVCVVQGRLELGVTQAWVWILPLPLTCR